VIAGGPCGIIAQRQRGAPGFRGAVGRRSLAADVVYGFGDGAGDFSEGKEGFVSASFCVAKIWFHSLLNACSPPSWNAFSRRWAFRLDRSSRSGVHGDKVFESRVESATAGLLSSL
jgi:hypothetical protein